MLPSHSIRIREISFRRVALFVVAQLFSHVRNYDKATEKKNHKYDLYHQHNNSQSCLWLSQISMQEKKRCPSDSKQKGSNANFFLRDQSHSMLCKWFHHSQIVAAQHQFFIDGFFFRALFACIIGPVSENESNDMHERWEMALEMSLNNKQDEYKWNVLPVD